MTEPTDGTTPPTGDRVEAVDLQLEMQRSYLDYAMSVIVGRALPDVRDGLKPVHRRVLYAMYDGGYRPDRGYNKCARVVGDVMGNYHPHGDSSIYDTLVRLTQPWALRYPLVDGQGNFGSPGNDPAAAMRYCVVGDTRVRMANGTDRAIGELAEGMAPSSEQDVELKILGVAGAPVIASKVFHSGSHPTMRVTTDCGSLQGTLNHPVLCLVDASGQPVLRWKLLAEVGLGDLMLHVDGQPFAGQVVPDGSAFTDPARLLPVNLTMADLRFAVVESVEDAGVQPVFSLRVDTDDHAFITDGFVSHNTECKMAPLAMEMVRDIDEDTVDFAPNYDGKTQEPVILPSRFPNLLVNGSAGIAVGMATNIPPHNLREVAAGVAWALEHPQASSEELLEALLARVTGPDFPTGALIMGRRGIESAYRTGRGSITMRAVVEVEEIQNRTCLVVTELPYQVNPDNLAQKIAELVRDGRIQGIADVRDETSSRTGQRLVIVLKRDAVAKVVLNNLYKHTQLQETFGANMLALVDGVPRTLPLDAFVRHWVTHQIDVVVRRTRYRLRKAEEQAHILRALLKALDRIDEVIALIRASASAEEARTGLMALLEIDEVQATEILNMQLRRLAALERQKLMDDYDKLMAKIEEFQAILASTELQRQIVGEELAAIVEKYGDERRTRIVPYDGDMSMEDLIPEEPVVVTITRDGYAKRTRVDLYRSQRRGGKGVKGAALRSDDIVDHFFVTTTHHWVLFFTDQGRVYRAKAYELPDAGRDARGQHVANLLAFQPDEQIAQVLTLRDYDVAPYLVLATRRGFVKKTRLSEYDSNRSGGIIAINFRDEEDALIGAKLVAPDDDLLLVSRKGQSVRFTADDAQLRPMGRNTGGVTGMRFRDGDELLAIARVVGDRDGDVYLVTVTDGGYAKRTSIDEYRVQGRGGTGIKAARLDGDRGALVGAFVGGEGDEVLVVMASGKVVRTPVAEVPPKGRATMGVILAKPDNGDSIVAVARNPEPVDEAVDEEVQALAAATGVAVPEGTAADDAAPISGDDEAVASSSASSSGSEDAEDADEADMADNAGGADEPSAGPGDEGTSE